MPVRAKLSGTQDPSKCVVSHNSEKQNWGKGHFKGGLCLPLLILSKTKGLSG